LDIYIACPLYDSDETTLITPAPIYSPHDSAAIAPPHIAGQKYPMVILDGKEITQEQLYTISPQTVERVDILKGKAAIALYGEKAGNGVMIIQLKKSGKPPVAWLGIHYGKQISNYSNKNEKAEEEDIFYDESLRDYKFLELSGYSYFERSGNNDHRRNFRKAIAKSVSGNYSTNAIILEPKTGDFNKRTGHEFPWIFGAFAIGLCIWTIMVLIPKINTAPAVPDADRQKENPFYSGFRYLIPREGYFITPLLIDMNLLVYLLMALSGIGFIDFNTTGLLKWGANSLPYTSDGQWWRLITCIFVHAGLIHLFSNMIALLFIGIILEPVIGKKTFAISYFLCGFTASVFSIWWHDDTISVGASGAIFGLYGIFLALLIMKSVSKELSKAFLASIIVFIAYNLAMGFANSVIDNACHIGGLTSGLLIGSYLASSDRFNDNNHPAG
jgi:TonB-dependent SusC/RagA subfamily outer membrane receptor